MAQYIKKLASGGTADEPELQVRTLYGNYDAERLLANLDNPHNEEVFLNLFTRRKDREHAMAAYTAVKLAVADGSLHQDKDTRWYGNGISDDRFIGYAINFTKLIYNLMTPIKRNTTTDSTKEEEEKTKFNAYSEFGKYFAGSLYSSDKLTNAIIEDWMGRDDVDLTTGIRSNKERLSALSSLLLDYKTNLENSSTNYDWGRYKSKEEYLNKILNAINQLNSFDFSNYTKDNQKQLQKIFDSLGMALARSLFDITKPLAAAQSAETLLTQTAEIERLKQVLKQLKPNYNWDVVENSLITTEYNKLVEEQKNNNQREDEYSAYANSNYTTNHYHLLPLTLDIDFATQLDLDLVNRQGYFKELYNEGVKHFTKHGVYTSTGDELKEEVKTYFNNLLHDFCKSSRYTDDTTNYKLVNFLKQNPSFDPEKSNKDYLSFVLKMTIADEKENGFDLLIPLEENPDAYILKESITQNGLAWVYNSKNGKLEWITADPQKTPTLNKILRQRWENNNPSRNLSWRKNGGIIQQLKNGNVLMADVGTYLEKRSNKNRTQSTITNHPHESDENLNEPVSLKGTDGAYVASACLDLTSMISSFFPGVGTAIAAGTGLTSTVATLFADINSGLGTGQALLNGILGLGMDVVGLVPGIGDAAKMGKITRNAMKWVPRVITLASTKHLFDDFPLAKSGFNKVIGKDGGWDSLTRDELMSMSHVLTSLTGLTRMGTSMALYHVKSSTPGLRTTRPESFKVKVKNKDGIFETKEVTQAQFESLKGAKNLEELNSLLKNIFKDGEYTFLDNVSGKNKITGKYNKKILGLRADDSSFIHEAALQNAPDWSLTQLYQDYFAKHEGKTLETLNWRDRFLAPEEVRYAYRLNREGSLGGLWNSKLALPKTEAPAQAVTSSGSTSTSTSTPKTTTSYVKPTSNQVATTTKANSAKLNETKNKLISNNTPKKEISYTKGSTENDPLILDRNADKPIFIKDANGKNIYMKATASLIDLIKALPTLELKLRLIQKWSGVSQGFAQGGKLEHLLALKKNGGIVKAKPGTTLQTITPAKETWYTRRYPQLVLEGFPDQYKRNSFYNHDLLNKHNTGDTDEEIQSIWNLASPEAFNTAYTNNLDLVGRDLNTYYNDAYNGKSLEDYVAGYNKDAASIRGFWHYGLQDNPTNYIANTPEVALKHNQLFRRMFANRSQTETNDTNRAYNIGYQDDDIESWMGTSTWKRRMDLYEKEFDVLTPEEKKKRVHKIGDLGWVYKKANGDIAILSPDEIKDLGLENPAQPQTPQPEQAPTPTTEGEKPELQDSSQEGAKQQPQKTGVGSGVISGIPGRSGKWKEWIKNFPDFRPEILDIARLMANLRGNSKMYDLAKQLRTPLKNPMVAHRNVYTGFDIELAANQQANQLLANAGLAKTSDASINEAIALEAQYKGLNITREGQLKSDQILRDTAEKQWAVDREVDRYNLGVADFNNAALHELYNQEIKAHMGKIRSDMDSINNYLMANESRLRLRRDDLRDKRERYQDKAEEAWLAHLIANDETVRSARQNWLDVSHRTGVTPAELYLAQYQYQDAQLAATWKYTLEYLKNKGVDISHYENNQPRVVKKGGTLDDTQVKKRSKDNDRLIKQIIAGLRENSKALDRLSKALLLSIRSILK